MPAGYNANQNTKLILVFQDTKRRVLWQEPYS